MEPAGAANIAHVSHLVLTHFSLLDIYLLSMDSINNCMRVIVIAALKN